MLLGALGCTRSAAVAKEPTASEATGAPPAASEAPADVAPQQTYAAPAAASSAAAAPPKASLDRWQLASPEGVQRLDGLYFGMSIEQAWKAQPKLRDAMSVTLETAAFDAAAHRIPELGEGSRGGNRWLEHKSRRGTWPDLGGAKWELRFDGRGLTMVTARYPFEQALRAAIAAWGEPQVRGRWEFWLDDQSHTRAAFTGCFQDSTAAGCNLELMPVQSEVALLDQILPRGGTRVGLEAKQLGFGEGLYQGDYTLYTAPPLPTTLWIPIQVRLDGGQSGRVVAYRVSLDFTYDTAGAERFMRALGERLPDLGSLQEECAIAVQGGVPVQACRVRRGIVLTVGVW
jgi:hypothetical protein